MASTADEVSTDEGLCSPPSVAPPFTPHFLFKVGEVWYEAVAELERRQSGEVLLLAQRRVRKEALTGHCLVRRLPSPSTYMRRRRLVEEVQLAFRLHHPSIAQVHHLGVYGDAPHVVMEYVPGPSLETLVTASVVRGRAMSEDFALYVGVELTEALHYAHMLMDEEGRSLGIVHRDVNPRHVVVGPHGEVKLMSFGAAYSLLVGREESPKSLVRGDVAYASPEYIRRESLTPRSDVFSLGVLLVELLTGTHLFDVADVPRPPQGRRLRAESIPSLPLKQMRALLASFDSDFVEKAVAALAPDVKAILHTTLHANPEERFASAAELRDALRAAQSRRGEPYGRREVVGEVAQVLSEGGRMRDKVEFGEAGLYPEGLDAHELMVSKEK
ncbi:serine/threonine protein kinase [Corallococcus macrosporus]|uniref:Protein kinase n=1 Tax=Corallococcus macrosporus DSM 14697 TaxID=1189310 RepID=A0A250JSL3_9BACT|nr:serine/threonine-protein kinase [Corallococcus macrosporus]ATB46361.1 protein kinase [Corallococcus macrosporus DSM 14697]